MGWYLRKSLRLGPLRFNLSKSGLGASVGIKGLRVGTGPRGRYLHAGREGLYYRASLEEPVQPEPGAGDVAPAMEVEQPAPHLAGTPAAAPEAGRNQFGIRLLRGIRDALLRRR